MEWRSVFGAQFLVISGAVGTLYLLKGGWHNAAAAVGAGLTALWFCCQGAGIHARRYHEDGLGPEDADTLVPVGLSLFALGCIGLVQNELGFLHASFVAAVLFLGVAAVVVGVSESDSEAEEVLVE